jgi:hypothetical protein
MRGGAGGREYLNVEDYVVHILTTELQTAKKELGNSKRILVIVIG